MVLTFVRPGLTIWRMVRPETPSLSGKEAIVLRLLTGGIERYGLQLVAESHGQLKRGTVYVTLSRMEEKGFVTSRQEEGRASHVPGIPRRLYRISGLGERVLREVRLPASAFVVLRPGLQA
jgi:PadR family transcriptional regulator